MSSITAELQAWADKMNRAFQVGAMTVLDHNGRPLGDITFHATDMRLIVMVRVPPSKEEFELLLQEKMLKGE